MAEETQKAKEYREFTPDAIKVAGNGSSYDDYVKLESDEAYPAAVAELKLGDKFDKNTNTDVERLYIWFEITDGEGKGQRYRQDYSPKVSPAGQSKQTNLTKFLTTLYGSHQEGIDPNDIIGMPCRIELSEPWGEKGLQFVKQVKRPLSSQKKVAMTSRQVEQPEDVTPANELSQEDLDGMFS